MRSAVNYPLYLPHIPGIANQLLKKGEIRAALREYERLSKLGSRAASTILAYLSLCGAVNGKPDVDRAEVLCGNVALKGYSYAQFVLGIIYWSKNRNRDAVEQMTRATEQGFLPALVELGGMFYLGTGADMSGARYGEQLVWRAHKSGHAYALMYIADMYLMGKLGRFKKALGYIIYPIAFIRYMFKLAKNPYSIRVLSFAPNRTKPFFRVGTVHFE